MKHHALRRLMSKLIDDFEHNHKAQIKFHFTMMVVWVILGIGGPVLIVLGPNIWVKMGVLFVYELSIYANWDTDYDASHAAQAAQAAEEKR